MPDLPIRSSVDVRFSSRLRGSASARLASRLDPPSTSAMNRSDLTGSDLRRLTEVLRGSGRQSKLSRMLDDVRRACGENEVTLRATQFFFELNSANHDHHLGLEKDLAAVDCAIIAIEEAFFKPAKTQEEENARIEALEDALKNFFFLAVKCIEKIEVREPSLKTSPPLEIVCDGSNRSIVFKGGCNEVILHMDDEQRLFALKRPLSSPNAPIDQTNQTRIIVEFFVMKSLGFAPESLELIRDDRGFGFAMQAWPTDLYKYIYKQECRERYGPLTPEIMEQIAVEVARQASEIYKHGIAHRDIKPSNIVIRHRPEGNIRVAIIDYAFSSKLYHRAQYAATKGYVPESYRPLCREYEEQFDFYKLWSEKIKTEKLPEEKQERFKRCEAMFQDKKKPYPMIFPCLDVYGVATTFYELMSRQRYLPNGPSPDDFVPKTPPLPNGDRFKILSDLVMEAITGINTFYQEEYERVWVQNKPETRVSEYPRVFWKNPATFYDELLRRLGRAS